MMPSDTHLWYKEAIIYELHVRCFYDSDGNGIGDFRGLTQKLDYLQDLGVTAIWLLPFYPSPLKDDGYDIADYRNIHPHYGTLHDFKIFLREAHKRGLKVITELVVNHTSDQHPWFQRARRSPLHSSYRNYYVWSDSQDKYKDTRIIFQDFENSNWSWDPLVKRYYWHRFYSHQPDLNFENPEVQLQIKRILSFWMKLGVDGVRLDAVPYLFEREGTNCENLPETHDFLKSLRAFVDVHFVDRMFLAEANQWPEDAAKYFGEGNECHMAFHFPLMPRLFMSIHLEDSLPIIEIFSQTPAIPENCQWALFLRNHDELTLEMVTDEERDYMFRVYAFDPQARVNLGIRHRLAPLLKNDRRKIELMNALLFSMAGTPVLYYGDEIGMGDNIYLGDRNGVRTPMQWSNDRNAGFSLANPQRLYLPPIIDPEYHFETVNVEAQQNNPYSLLWWMKQLIALRKRFSAFAHGTTQFLKPVNRKMLVFVREYQNEILLIISNLSRFSQYVELDLSKYKGYHPLELFSGGRFPSIGDLPYFLTLGPYGYYWFALEKEPQETFNRILEREKEKKVLEFSTQNEGEEIFHESKRRTLDVILRTYLIKRIWFQKSLLLIDRTKSKIIDHFAFPSKEFGKIHMIVLQLVFTSGVVERYPFFLAYLKGDSAEQKIKELPERVLVKFKQINHGENEGVLYDVSEEWELFEIFSGFIHKQRRLKGEMGEMQGIPFSYLREKSPFLKLGTKEGAIRRESNAIFFPFDGGELKIFTMMEEGLDADVETRAFLMHHTSFRGFSPLLGYLKYPLAGTSPVAMATEMSTSPREYNAMALTAEEAKLFLLKMEAEKKVIPDKTLIPQMTFEELSHQPIEVQWLNYFQGYPQIVQQLGETTAELHLAFATPTNNKEFIPVSYTSFYLRSLYQTLRRRFQEGFEILKDKKNPFSEGLREEIKQILENEQKVMAFLSLLTQLQITGQRCRRHGRYTLESLLYTGKQFLIADFSGDLAQSYSEKKYKRSPLVDVASMLISFAEASFTTATQLQGQGLLGGLERKVLIKWSGSWAIWMGSRFLEAYFSKTEKASFLPAASKVKDYLLGVFLLEACFGKIVKESGKTTPALESALFMLLHVISVYCGRSFGGANE